LRRITCEQVGPWLEPYVDGALEPLTSAIVQAHVAECPSCASQVAQLEAVDVAVCEWFARDSAVESDPAGLRSLAENLHIAAGRVDTAVRRRAAPLAWMASGARRLGLTPRAVAGGVAAGAAWGGQVAAKGVAMAAKSLRSAGQRPMGDGRAVVKQAATDRGAGRSRHSPARALAGRAAGAMGRYAWRVASTGARRIGRGAMALG
jgi:anti-sigma factor RsiW